MLGRVPFERLGHLIVVPVRLGGTVETRFVLDTGIGVNLLSEKLAKQAGWISTGQVASGRRMSGQEIRMPLGNLPRIELGGRGWDNVLASPLDMGGFHPALKDLGGFLSLGLFESDPFTIDYQRSEIDLPGPPSSGSSNSEEWEEAPLALERDGASLSAKVDLELPNDRVAHVEIDTGSDSLILHDRYREDFDIRSGAPNVRTIEGKDETGHSNVRHFATVPGRFRVLGTNSIAQQDPPVMFQNIIHDGLLGDDFLKRFRVRFDVERARIGFAPGFR